MSCEQLRKESYVIVNHASVYV